MTLNSRRPWRRRSSLPLDTMPFPHWTILLLSVSLCRAARPLRFEKLVVAQASQPVVPSVPQGSTCLQICKSVWEYGTPALQPARADSCVMRMCSDCDAKGCEPRPQQIVSNLKTNWEGEHGWESELIASRRHLTEKCPTWVSFLRKPTGNKGR